MALLSGTLALTAGAVTLGLRDRLGFSRALGLGLAAAMVSASAIGIVLMDLGRLQRGPLLVGLVAALVGWLAITRWLRAWWAPRPAPPLDRADTLGVAALGLVLLIGAAIRLDPSPYLHGGQDQGIYVNVGHHIARTGRLRPVDRMMAGQVPGVAAEHIRAAHHIKPVPEGSPLAGVREGRWIAGLHVEDAHAGRLVPGFFHLLPVWFAMTELELGFDRSTDVLVLLALLSQLAAFGVGWRLAAGARPAEGDRRRGWAVGLMAAAGLAVHPLDLWISTFTVSEGLARACLLGAAALGLEGAAAERRGEPGAMLLSALAGLVFAAGVATRGSMLALAIGLAMALVLVRHQTPRSRRALLWALVVGSTAATCQAVVHSWPYFFSAASNHFHVPRIHPSRGEAVAWTIAAGFAVIIVDARVARVRRRLARLGSIDRWVRGLVWAVLLAAVAAAVYRATDDGDAYGSSQQVAAVLLRYGGPVSLGLGLVGLGLAPARVDAWRQPWVLLGAMVVLVAALKEGVRYDFYYARYLVADAVPVLIVAAAWGLARLAHGAAVRWGPRAGAAVLAVALLGWHAHALRVLVAPVFWTRDLAHGPEDLRALLERVPDDGVLFFDARAPGRWRGILATPALLSFDRNVWVYPDNRFVERALGAGTPVYMISGGWEVDDHQRWPDRGPWRTTVVARGYYRARRAEVVEGAMPQALTEWGGPWELHRIDRSIWRGHGAFSLYPGSRFVVEDTRHGLRTAEIPMVWEQGARVELHVGPEALEGCEPSVELVAQTRRRLAPEPGPEPGAEARVRLFAMPEPDSGGSPQPAALHVRWGCAQGGPVDWARLSMRWERR